MMQTSPVPHAGSPVRSAIVLDIVVPFTTPELTAAALRAARLLGDGLEAKTRLVKIQVLPYPLDIDSTPVPVNFWEGQLNALCGSASGVHCEIRIAREFLAGLRDAVGEHSLVVIATAKRPWRTRAERLARKIRKAGLQVVLV